MYEKVKAVRTKDLKNNVLFNQGIQLLFEQYICALDKVLRKLSRNSADFSITIDDDYCAKLKK